MNVLSWAGRQALNFFNLTSGGGGFKWVGRVTANTQNVNFGLRENSYVRPFLKNSTYLTLHCKSVFELTFMELGFLWGVIRIHSVVSIAVSKFHC